MVALMFVSPALADTSCHYMNSRSSLLGYETGGPYLLDHFHLTKGRTDLREFLWKHWHDHIMGVAEAREGTIDAGTLTVLYVVQPDARGDWAIDVESGRPLPSACRAFHADSLARIRIPNPDEDYPSQTLGVWPTDNVPKGRLADSEVENSKYFWVFLMAGKKAVGGAI